MTDRRCRARNWHLPVYDGHDLTAFYRGTVLADWPRMKQGVVTTAAIVIGLILYFSLAPRTLVDWIVTIGGAALGLGIGFGLMRLVRGKRAPAG